jgi:tRNA-splicing ligase RtcB
MIEIESPGVPIKAWVEGVPVEDDAKRQLQSIAKLPVVWPHVAVMPDVHLGIGATVGSVVPTRAAIIPAAAGVDLGCGMAAVRTNVTARDLPDSLGAMRSAIEAAIPHGRTNNGAAGDRGAWRDPPPDVAGAWSVLDREYRQLCARQPKMVERTVNTAAHLGTLGTGNHFVEVCLDTEDRVWIMLHSGSRGVGNRIGSYFIELAKIDMRAAHGNLPESEDLAYLTEGTEHFDDYVAAVGWAQDFARTNREIMMERALEAVRSIVRPDVPPGVYALRSECGPTVTAVNCHHNYVQRERHFGEDLWVTRKGAVSARAGQLGIIPGSMGAKSFIVRGRGDADSFHSCSHGAGRKMSRNAAKKAFTLADHAAATAGIECRKDEDVIDETPGAYKSIDDVMYAQRDLVEVAATLRQVLCVKG